MAKHTPVTSPLLMLQLTIHVRDMSSSIAFYERLGGSIIHGGREADRVLMQLGTTQIGLVARPPLAEHAAGTVELNFHCALPLPQLQDRLRAAGMTAARVTADPVYGHQLQVISPDGLLIRINQLEPDLCP